MKSTLSLTVSIVLLILTVGCATVPPDGAGREDPLRPQPMVNLTHEQGGVGDAITALLDEEARGVVLMNGLEHRELPPLSFQEKPMDKAVALIADQADLRLAAMPGYFFIYSEGYEVLLDRPKTSPMPNWLVEENAAITLPINTPIFSALAILSHTLKRTIVADQLLADQLSGIVSTREIPLIDGLSGVLQSTRIVPSQVAFEWTEDYLFLRSAANQNTGPWLRNANALAHEDRALLDRRVSIVLPEPPSSSTTLPYYDGALPLASVIENLSRQLGAPVVVEKGARGLPVNPMALNNVTVQNAVELIIRQWPVPGFSYSVKEGQIMFHGNSG